jgi:hypothetical protein
MARRRSTAPAERPEQVEREDPTTNAAQELVAAGPNRGRRSGPAALWRVWRVAWT